MKTNKLFIYLLLALPAFFLQSCQTEEDNVFDRPYSERMGEFLQKAQDTLTASQYGWVLDYYPQRDQAYGGVAYTIKFTKDNATVRYENNPDDGEVKSLYKMKEDDGPVLSFDTYNTFLHIYATPKDGEYRGKEGDFEFVIDSIGADRIKIHGKRSLNTMYLRKLSGEASEYIEKVTELTNLFVFSDVALNIGGKPYTLVVTDKNNRQLAIYDGGKLVAESAYAFTDKGIRLYEPITLNGVQLYDLTFDKATAKFTGTGVESAASNVDVNLIANMIGAINASNGEKTITKTIPYLNKLDITCDAPWLHLSKDGDKLTIKVDANPIATNARGAKLKISNGIKEAQVQIQQFDLSVLMGTYELTMTSYVPEKDGFFENTRTARLRYVGSGANRKFYLNVHSGYGSDYVFPLTYVASANAFLMQSGQKVMTIQGRKATYNIGNAFNIDDKRGTGTRTDVYNLITFTVADNGDISASLCGPLFGISNGQVQYTGLTTERIILLAYTGEQFTSENIDGLWDKWINPVITKKASTVSPAKPSILPEESFDNTASVLMPQYLPNRNPSFDVDFSSRLTTSVAKQVKLNK
ncbi:DUF4302 domain-containing protein [Prevotella melaninogenica]|uniref:BACON domain-containing protein n=1 Tax=Prevotella melaninogenica DNF00666 TaxID=1401073 RepID=A0A096CBV0_9BACT|nr:DUF4302 domain-containing protein [Prevotella melaninogenica]KGF52377.1 hypothetical protein HMPREF0661_02935 [Prevotella melaninogenica DNF00666]